MHHRLLYPFVCMPCADSAVSCVSFAPSLMLSCVTQVVCMSIVLSLMLHTFVCMPIAYRAVSCVSWAPSLALSRVLCACLLCALQTTGHRFFVGYFKYALHSLTWCKFRYCCRYIEDYKGKQAILKKSILQKSFIKRWPPHMKAYLFSRRIFHSNVFRTKK